METIIMKYKLWTFIFASVFIISGCGGGSDNGDNFVLLYGSIAVNKITKAAGIAALWESQAKANNTALSQCGTGCEVVLEFGPGQCGALARGSNGALGWSSGTSKADASQKAVTQCVGFAGIGCVSLLAECN